MCRELRKAGAVGGWRDHSFLPPNYEELATASASSFPSPTISSYGPTLTISSHPHGRSIMELRRLWDDMRAHNEVVYPQLSQVLSTWQRKDGGRHPGARSLYQSTSTTSSSAASDTFSPSSGPKKARRRAAPSHRSPSTPTTVDADTISTPSTAPMAIAGSASDEPMSQKCPAHGCTHRGYHFLHP